MIPGTLFDLLYFYPRPHVEGDTELADRVVYSVNFYPRPHVEGDGFFYAPGNRPGEFLPTPSRGGRRDGIRKKQQNAEISTHALTWRATTKRRDKHPNDEFLPTPSRGGRLS